MLKSKKNIQNPVDTATVSPYRNPEKILGLISQICAVSSRYEEVEGAILSVVSNVLENKFNEFTLNEHLDLDSTLNSYAFRDILTSHCKELARVILMHESDYKNTIAIAGGFSSGKSSFLNQLTGCNGLLPTGVEPVSVIPTFLNCSNKYSKLQLKGVNLKNAIVDLDLEVLDVLQHSSNSNVYLASVLERLYLDIPSKELDGLVFIDTPGYNNSDKANSFSGKSDMDRALEGMEDADILFWLIDIERGTVPKMDLDILMEFEGPKIIIFNKADKKGEAEAKKIVDAAAKQVMKNFPDGDIMDIMAYSALDNRVYHSANGYDLKKVISELDDSDNMSNFRDNVLKNIEELFNQAIEYNKEKLNSNSKLHKEWCEILAKEEKSIRDMSRAIAKQIKKYDDNYDRNQVIIKRLVDSAVNMREGYSSIYDEVVDFYNDNSYMFWGDKFLNIINKNTNRYNSLNSSMNSSFNQLDRMEEWPELNYFSKTYEEAANQICEIYKRNVDDALAEVNNSESIIKVYDNARNNLLNSLRGVLRTL